MTRRELWGKPKAQFRNCCYCELSISRNEITREHLIPKSKGGKGSNIAPCCRACNQQKKDMLLIDFILILMKQRSNMVKVKVIKRTEVKLRNSIKFLLLLYPGEYDFIFK